MLTLDLTAKKILETTNDFFENEPKLKILNDVLQPIGTEHYMFLVSLSVQLKNKTIIELGTHKGVSSYILGYGNRFHNSNNNILTYDIIKFPMPFEDTINVKYKLEDSTTNDLDINEEGFNIDNTEQLGIINLTTSNITGSSNILLQEYVNISHSVINSIFYEYVDCTTTSDEVVDLSAIVFNTINPCNNSSIIIDIRTALACSFGDDETITIELWRDSTMLMYDCSLGSSITTEGLIIPYNVTYLDENITSGPKKYYLKYKLERNLYQKNQGILNIKTSQNGSPNIFLREITNTSTIFNMILNNISNFTTTTSDIIDLSNSFFNVITLASKSNILVSINVTLFCSYGYDERITLQLWRDSTMISEDVGLGTYNASILRIPYNLTYLDENVNSGIIKYYLKYKLSSNHGINMGLVNIKNSSTFGSSSFFLRQI